DEEIAAEQIVPGVLVDDADRQLVGRIGAGIAIQDVKVFAGQGREQIAAQRFEVRALHRPVHLAPVDLALAGRVADDELVIRRAAGVRARAARQRTFGGDDAFVAPDGLFIQRGRREIPAHAVRANPLALEAAGSLDLGAHRTRLLSGAVREATRKI